MSGYTGREKKEVKAKSLDALKKLGHGDMQLDEYERMSKLLCKFICHHQRRGNAFFPETIANEVIHPDDIEVTFSGKYT